MSKATTAVAFVFGAALGSVTAWYFTKKTYERIAQEEIDSVKETFSKLYKNDADVAQNEVEATDEDEEEDPDKAEYRTIAEREGYIPYQSSLDIGKKKEPEEVKCDTDYPYVIPPESFDELENYGVISLTYYADKVLVDENDRPIEDMMALVGFEDVEELESHFGEHEDDSIFVRNDRLKHDIEILYDPRTYADVLEKEPYKAEV